MMKFFPVWQVDCPGVPSPDTEQWPRICGSFACKTSNNVTRPNPASEGRSRLAWEAPTWHDQQTPGSEGSHLGTEAKATPPYEGYRRRGIVQRQREMRVHDVALLQHCSRMGFLPS
jgi:hypothetical protein